MKKAVTFVLAIGMMALFSAPAFAQQPVEYKVTVKAEVVKGSPGDHFLTFNVPVAIPDATLPAGTYIFSLMGSSVVQVSTADRSEQIAMFFTTPIKRAEPVDAYEVTLKPSSDGAPRRISAWYLPNNQVGLQFQYRAEAAGER